MESSILNYIGSTPLLRLERLERRVGLSAKIMAKIEFFNPGGSVKDRVALHMILKAEEEGQLQPGATIIEPTSGNTGVGLALVAAVRGYNVILTMPETMSVERRKILKAYGAKLVLTDGAKGMSGAIARAEELRNEIPNSTILQQFDNHHNADAHYLTTGPEIWSGCNGAIDAFVAGIGTGGTITGVGRFLKEQREDVKVVGVEPLSSPFLTEGRSGKHGLQGIGAGFKPSILDMSLVDSISTVTEEDAYVTARLLASHEGLLCGITSGAAMHVACSMAKSREYEGKCIVALLPDTGERYLSTPLWSE